ncbi:hypothetical protein Trydic_g16176 [Trypoxylus dichotomus]
MASRQVRYTATFTNFWRIWEVAVKGVKHHMKRITENTVFTYEQYLAFLTQTEGILNSQPLTQLTDDPSSSISENYFNTCGRDGQRNTCLNSRRGQNGTRTMKPDLKEQNLPPFKWKIGRIEKTFPEATSLQKIDDVIRESDGKPKPDELDDYVTYLCGEHPELAIGDPYTVEEVLAMDNREEWKKVMGAESEALIPNTWTLRKLLKCKKAIWCHLLKYNQNLIINRRTGFSSAPRTFVNERDNATRLESEQFNYLYYLRILFIDTF